MSNTYRVVVIGMGKRGMHHATTFKANKRFELAGICDIDSGRLAAAAPKLGNPPTSTDAAALAKQVKPDVFCFCTLPNLRLPFIKLGIECGAKLIAFEKPVAMTSAEGLQIKQALEAAGVKAVVSHQHRYGEHYKKVKEIVASGALGRVHTVYGTATGWAAHMLSHLIDYTSWFNDYVPGAWAMAQAAGRGKLADAHTSPDYIAGVVHFQNGVRGIYDCGAGAPDVPEVPYWWRKCRIGAQGSEGFAEVMTGGGWRAVTKNGVQSGPGGMDYNYDMPPYVQQMADWLDNPHRVHPCAFAHAWRGFEIMAALYRSVAAGGQVALPLTSGADEIALLKEKMPAQKPILTLAESAKEYPAQMEVIIQPDAEAAATLVARLIARELRAKPHLVLGLATGRTMERVYRALVRLHRAAKLDFSLCQTFNLDEYIGLPPTDRHSYRYYMNRHLFGRVNIDRRNTHLPDGLAADLAAECSRYEDLIAACGGIDLQVLGIGAAGHIGFNEPLSALRSRTREKALTPATITQNAPLFGGDRKRVPKRAITMGVGTILEARRLLVLVTGKEKADILAKAVEGPITSMVSATALQLHAECTVVVDEAAASKLQGQEYYRWIFAHEPEWREFRSNLGPRR